MIRCRSESGVCRICCSQCTSSTYGLPRSLQNTVAPSMALYARLFNLPNNADRLISLMTWFPRLDSRTLRHSGRDRLHPGLQDDGQAMSSNPADDLDRAASAGPLASEAAGVRPTRTRNSHTT